MLVAINPFVRRQTASSRFAHFEGSEAELIKLVEKHWESLRSSGAGYAIRVPPAGFFSSIVPIYPKTELESRLECRRSGEDPVLVTVAVGEKVEAGCVDIIIYSGETLAKDGDRSSDASFEIISINAYPGADVAPMHPVTMARNMLEKAGGTKVDYTAEEFANAVWFWATHTNVEPRE